MDTIIAVVEDIASLAARLLTRDVEVAHGLKTWALKEALPLLANGTARKVGEEINRRATYCGESFYPESRCRGHNFARKIGDDTRRINAAGKLIGGHDSRYIDEGYDNAPFYNRRQAKEDVRATVVQFFADVEADERDAYLADLRAEMDYYVAELNRRGEYNTMCYEAQMRANLTYACENLWLHHEFEINNVAGCMDDDELYNAADVHRKLDIERERTAMLSEKGYDDAYLYAGGFLSVEDEEYEAYYMADLEYFDCYNEEPYDWSPDDESWHWFEFDRECSDLIDEMIEYGDDGDVADETYWEHITFDAFADYREPDCGGQFEDEDDEDPEPSRWSKKGTRVPAFPLPEKYNRVKISY